MRIHLPHLLAIAFVCLANAQGMQPGVDEGLTLELAPGVSRQPIVSNLIRLVIQNNSDRVRHLRGDYDIKEKDVFLLEYPTTCWEYRSLEMDSKWKPQARMAGTFLGGKVEVTLRPKETILIGVFAQQLMTLKEKGSPIYVRLRCYLNDVKGVERGITSSLLVVTSFDPLILRFAGPDDPH